MSESFILFICLCKATNKLTLQPPENTQREHGFDFHQNYERKKRLSGLAVMAQSIYAK